MSAKKIICKGIYYCTGNKQYHVIKLSKNNHTNLKTEQCHKETNKTNYTKSCRSLYKMTTSMPHPLGSIPPTGINHAHWDQSRPLINH